MEVKQVISRSQMMPLILEKCPAFRPSWEKHLKFWDGEEAGLFNDVGQFAHFVVDSYEHEDTQSVEAALGVIEDLLVEGDEEVRGAASIGFLEDLRNTSSWRPFGSRPFAERLGPQSRLAWAEIEEMWRGKTNLGEVIRSEIEQQKKKE
jgi:hypothetical protein